MAHPVWQRAAGGLQEVYRQTISGDLQTDLCYWPKRRLLPANRRSQLGAHPSVNAAWSRKQKKPVAQGHPGRVAHMCVVGARCCIAGMAVYPSQSVLASGRSGMCGGHLGMGGILYKQNTYKGDGRDCYGRGHVHGHGAHYGCSVRVLASPCRGTSRTGSPPTHPPRQAAVCASHRCQGPAGPAGSPPSPAPAGMPPGSAGTSPPLDPSGGGGAAQTCRTGRSRDPGGRGRAGCSP